MTAAHRVLGGRYELVDLLATGGMGQVWRGRDALLHRPVAVKVLRSEYTGDPTFRARFRAEAQHTAVLDHPNVATLHDYGEEPAGDGGEHLAWLVMELVEGEPLSAVLARRGRLPVEETLDLLRQTAAALAAAHRAGVVHRDVKPGNLLVGADGSVTVTDFGIAWSASSVPLTQTGQVVGTAHYLSPEQAAGERAGPASDVYSLGMVAYECLAGRRAFDGENSVQIALRHLREVPDPLPGDVPPAVRTLVERALVKDPADRLADGEAVAAAVEDVLAGRPLAPAPAAPDTLTFPALLAPRRRRSAVRLLAPVAALLAGVGIGAAALQGSGGTGVPDTEVGATLPAGLVLVAEDYLGRPVGEVAAELGALGLRVQRVAETAPDVVPGSVTSLGPTGAVEPGELVTVGYAVAPGTDADPPADEPTAGPTGTVRPVEAGEPAPAPADEAPAANGNGNGAANGNGGGRGNAGGRGSAGGNGNSGQGNPGQGNAGGQGGGRGNGAG